MKIPPEYSEFCFFTLSTLGVAYHCEIAPFVLVNHWGTIIMAEPLELPDDGRRYIDEETDWNYAPLDGENTTNHKPCTTISDFMAAYVH